MTKTNLDRKLATLTRLVELYVKFMKVHTKVEVLRTKDEDTKADIIRVRYSAPHIKNQSGTEYAEWTEFPVNHIGKRINHYRYKVRSEFKKRHETKYYLTK